MHQLHLAASRHPDYYRVWIAEGEPRAISAWCAARAEHGSQTRIGCYIVGGDRNQRARTEASVMQALGADARVYAPGQSLADALRAAIAEGRTGFLILSAGDALSPALGPVLARMPGPSREVPILYWDHDAIEGGARTLPLIKPDWDPYLASSVDLLTRASLIWPAAMLDAIEEGAGPQPNPSDLAVPTAALLRVAQAALPVHIPLILSHRQVDSSCAGLLTPPRAAPAPPEAAAGAVTIIIPTRDQAELLAVCIERLSILQYAGSVDILVLDNDSVEPETHALFDRLASDRTQILPYPGRFNYAAMINFAAQAAKGDFLCLLNNDVEALDGVWLSELVRYAAEPGVGAVGARLLYPDGAIQHVGVAAGIGGAAGHVQKGAMPGDIEFSSWHRYTRRVSAVTGACMVIDRSKFFSVGGMDPANFAVDFNDVDLCLRLEASGLVNLIVPDATLIHHESKSRGAVRTGESLEQFKLELAALKARWDTDAYRDPWHSPLFRRESERCLLSF
jgi:GT2 family glycosyltransferase